MKPPFQVWLKGLVSGNIQAMWRIHFTAEDLARTRIAPPLGPLAETMFGLALARSATSRWPMLIPAVLLGWSDQTRRRLTPAMRPLTDLAPAGGLGVDLWSLTGEASTIEEGLAAATRTGLAGG
jgi:hypothetical protein